MSKLTAIGINVFGGGFTIGMQNAGYKVLAQLEECKAGSRTFDMNKRFSGILHPLAREDWPRMRADVVYANPPCAPWSAGNTRAGMTAEHRFADPRLEMTRTTMREALRIEPQAFVLESVARAYTMGRPYYDKWANEWMKRGYAVTYFLTDALLHGVASTRQRFHFIAHRAQLKLEEPDMRSFVPRTVRAAIWDLRGKSELEHHNVKSIDTKLQKRMGLCEPGGQLLNTPNLNERRYSFLVRRLLWDAPAFTVMNMDEIVHPDGKRWLTHREGLRLTSYPDDFVIHGPKEATQAVLPLVGEHIGRIVGKAIQSGRTANVALNITDWLALAAPFRPGRVREQLREAGEL